VGVEEGEAIENRLLTRVIENAQKKVEARNFDIRKHLLDYDDVMNRQRRAFYERRRDALSREDVHTEVLDMTEGAVVDLMEQNWPEKGSPDDEALSALVTGIEAQFGVSPPPEVLPRTSDAAQSLERDGVGRAVYDAVVAVLETKRQQCDAFAQEYALSGYPKFEGFERDILLRILDMQWKDHLHTMDGLREGIGLRGYASRDPKLEYQREGYGLFEEMNARIDMQALEIVFKFTLPQPRGAEVPQQAAPAPRPLAAPRPAFGPVRQPAPGSVPAAGAGGKGGAVVKVGRNDPCPCGSGKKYKKCCGAA
jgi:preprotein translocase subunit SecA